MIRIEVDRATQVNGKFSIYISFEYDEELVNLMRQESSRFYHTETKEWELPLHRLSYIVNLLEYDVIEIAGCILDESVELPADFTFKTTPFEHQQEALEYALNNDRFILGDDPGLGKTKVVIDIAIAKRLERYFKHCLIICGVNGLKWNWQREIDKHSFESGYILGTRYTKKGTLKQSISNAEKLEDLYEDRDDFFLITNVESLRDKDIANRVNELIKDGVIGMVAIDEVHKCSNTASQQGKGLLKTKDAEILIPMTGTLILNDPLNAYMALRLVGAESHSFYIFKDYYCMMDGFTVTGYRNMSRLRAQINNVMLRRRKDDVLDLPEKIYSTEYVEMSKKQSNIYAEILRELRENIDKIKLSPNPLVQMIRLRQATGYTGILSTKVKESAKLDRLEEMIEDVVDSGEKCLVFSNWTDITDECEKRLKKYNPAIITGKTKDREKQVQEDKFKQEDDCKVLIGTTGAMGTGLTFTNATWVFFVDEPWNKATKEQAADRTHRIGTTSTVNIVTLITKNTIDEKISDLVELKGAIADFLVDGVADLTKPELIDFLLS